MVFCLLTPRETTNMLVETTLNGDKQMIEDKEELLDRIAESTVADMDMKCLETFAYESMYTYLESLSDTDLLTHFGKFHEQMMAGMQESTE